MLHHDTAQRLRVLPLVVLPFLGTLVAIVLLWERYVFPRDLLLLATFYTVTALGITVGYHRMLTHQGFHASPFLRGIFLILGCMALEGAPDVWAATHIKHHALSDKEGDPHSPLEGFWHAHMGWLFSARNFPEVREYAPHLLQDRVVQFVSRTGWLWALLSVGLPGLIGGWTGLVWGSGVRIFLVNHVTWSVNSVCHCFGRRPFETGDESRNEWLVGLLGFGEGWHNNHHAFPRNAFHGMRWWQFDLSGYLIRLFEKLGLVWEVQRVSEEAITAKQERSRTIRASFEQLRGQLSGAIGSAYEELRAFDALLAQHPIPSPDIQRRATATLAEAKGRLEEMRSRMGSMAMHKPLLLSYQIEISNVVRAAKDRVMEEYRRAVPAVASS